MRAIRHRSTRNGLLSDDAIHGACASRRAVAAVGIVTTAISIDGGGRLGYRCRLGLGDGGEEGEEGEEIHWCVKR
jgi:hypothetical protein